MRIITTQYGESQFNLLKIENKQLEEVKRKKKIKEDLNKKEKWRKKTMIERNEKDIQKLRKLTNINNNHNENSSYKELINKKEPYLNTVKSKIFPTLEDEKISEVIIKQKKIPIPKIIYEKYNSQKDFIEDSIIMPSLPLSLTRNEKFYNKDGTKKKYLSIKEILKDETLYSLKEKKEKEKRIKELNTKITHESFRTNYGEKDMIKELYNKLNTELDVNKINLIKYLHEKDTLSEAFIKKFSDFSEEKLNKLNKICQIISFRREVERLNEDIIKDKVKSNDNRIKLEYKESIDQAKYLIEEYKNIIGAYTNKVDKKEIYGDIFRKTKMEWEKANLRRLQRRTNKEVVNPYFEVEGNNENEKNKLDGNTKEEFNKDKQVTEKFMGNEIRRYSIDELKL